MVGGGGSKIPEVMLTGITKSLWELVAGLGSMVDREEGPVDE